MLLPLTFLCLELSHEVVFNHKKQRSCENEQDLGDSRPVAVTVPAFVAARLPGLILL